MNNSVSKIPSDCEGFILYLIVQDAEKAIDFYTAAFGGKRGFVLKRSDGDVERGEIVVGRNRIRLAQEREEWGVQGAQTIGACRMTLTLYLDS